MHLLGSNLLLYERDVLHRWGALVAPHVHLAALARLRRRNAAIVVVDQGRVASCRELHGAHSLGLLGWVDQWRCLDPIPWCPQCSIFEELSWRVELEVLHRLLHELCVLQGRRLDALVHLRADRFVEWVALGIDDVLLMLVVLR